MHWTRRVGLLCLGLTVIATARTGLAQAPVTSTTSGTVILDDFSGAMSLSNDGGTYLLFHKIVGDGVGYPDGYSRIGLRAKLVDWETSHLFGEMHGLISDNGRFGYNLGGGYRWMYNDGVFGLHSWYDNHESNTRHRYEQVSFGAEYLSPGLDLRANGYVPTGNRENFLRIIDPGTETFYQQNQILTIGTGLYERALNGFDVEAGVPMPFLNWLRGYAGAYLLNDKNDETWGFKSRFEARLAEGVILNAVVTDDERYSTNVNLSVEIRYAGGSLPTRFGQDFSALSRRYDQVWRDWQVHIGQTVARADVPLINPDTGNPYFLYWVDNTNTGGGDGTFENPNAILPGSAAEADIFLVRRGAGDTLGNIRLSNNQRLLGEGIPHLIDTDRLGTIQLPDFATAGPNPTLAPLNLVDPIVTLASNNEVSGFNITGGNAIGGTDVSGFDIHDVNIEAAAPVAFLNASGAGSISDSTFTVVGGGPAIAIGSTLSTLQLDIENVETTGGTMGLFVAGTGSSITLDVAGFTGTDHSLSGIEIQTDSSVLNATLDDIVVTGLTGSGVVMDIDSTTGTTTLTNLDASDNAGDGLRALFTDGSVYTLNVIDSDVSGNDDDNFDVDVEPGSQVVFFVDPTDASGAGDNNVELQVVGNPILTANTSLKATFEETNLTDAGRDAIQAFVDNRGALELIVTDSPANGAARDGLNLLVTDESTATISVDGGTFADAGRNAVNTQVLNGSDVSLTLLDTPGNGNNGSGFVFDVAGGIFGASSLTANVTNGNFSDNPVSNVAGTSSGNSTVDLNFENVTADNLSSTGGLNLLALTGGDISVDWVGGSISNTQGNGVQALADGVGSGIDLSFEDVNIDNNTQDGIRARLTNGGAGSTLGLSLLDSTVRDNNGNGVDVEVAGATATGTLAFGGTIITGNTGDGVQFDVSGGAVVTGQELASAIDNDFSGNGGNAIDGLVTGAGSQATLAITGANLSSVSSEAVVFDVNTGGQLTFSLTDSALSSQGGDGLLANANGGAAIFNLNNVTANGNAGNGYAFNGTNSANFDVNFTGTMEATGNDESGIFFNMASGSDIAFDIVGGDLSNNGTTGNFSGLDGTVTGAGSTAAVTFTDTTADGNTQDGYEFEVDNGGSLTAVISSTATGTSSASGNTRHGVSLTGTGATLASLDVVGAGAISNNGGNGVNVVLSNVTQADVGVQGPDLVIEGNTGHGINLDVTNTLLSSLLIDQVEIRGNGGDGVHLAADNSDLTAGTISRNIIEENANGISVDLTNGSDWNLTIGGARIGFAGDVGNNQINLNTGAGIVLNADSGNSSIAILNNDIVSNAVENVSVDLNGNAIVDLDINGNEIDGDGRLGGFQIGRNFTLSTFNQFFNGFPPDTMGSVGHDHIFEITNFNVAIYDKNTGAVISNISDEQFWFDAGITFLPAPTGDPRVIFDLQSQRWFVVAFDSLANNNLYVAVSRTADPTDGFQAVTFLGDDFGFRFVDFPTLGVDADGIYIGTNNFNNFSGANDDVGLFVIPKASLLTLVPTTTGATFFAQTPQSVSPDIMQAVVDFYSPADGRAITLSAEELGDVQLNRIDVIDVGLITTQMTATQAIPVDPFIRPQGGNQPGGALDLDNQRARLRTNVVAVNGSLWLTHGILGSTGTDAIRWYEIDEATNTVLQSGTIEDPDLDFIYPSIAVNQDGQVVIGFTSTGDTQFASTAVVYGDTVNGVTTFQAPVTTQAGGGVQSGFGPFTRNRWGDYSATVLDPSDPSNFWTFQEFVSSDDNYSIQATEITFDERSTLVGTTAGNGVSINLNGNSQLAAGSTFNDNVITGHATGDGLNINVGGTANVAGFTMTGTEISGNGDQGIDVLVASADPTERSVFNIGQLGGNRNTISGNGDQNILLTTTAPAISQLQTAANPDVLVQTGQNNPVPGTFRDLASNDIVSVTFNVLNSDIEDSVTSHGLSLQIGSSTLVNAQIAGNTFSNNAGDDIVIAPVVSNAGVPANPPSSINNAAPNSDVLVFDPVAHLDLALGSADVNGNNIPDSTPLGTVQNVGETIVVTFLGDSFTNADPFKTNRQVLLAGQVQIAGTLNTNNTFSGVPDVNAIFAPQAGTFNIVPATLFPDSVVP